MFSLLFQRTALRTPQLLSRVLSRQFIPVSTPGVTLGGTRAFIVSARSEEPAAKPHADASAPKKKTASKTTAAKKKPAVKKPVVKAASKTAVKQAEEAEPSMLPVMSAQDLDAEPISELSLKEYQPPKRPSPPFFLWVQAERKKRQDTIITLEDAQRQTRAYGAEWQTLSEAEKQVSIHRSASPQVDLHRVARSSCVLRHTPMSTALSTQNIPRAATNTCEPSPEASLKN